MSTLRTHIVVMVGVCLAITSGCRPNHRYVSYDNIKVSASYVNGEPVYRNLHIGTGGSPFYANLDNYGEVELDLGGHSFVQLEDLTVKMLKEKSDRVEDLSHPGYGTWTAGERIIIGPMIFCVHGDQILELYASAVGIDNESQAPKFRGPKSSEPIAMPFTHDELTKLFGEPKEVNDVWHQ